MVGTAMEHLKEVNKALENENNALKKRAGNQPVAKYYQTPFESLSRHPSVDKKPEIFPGKKEMEQPLQRLETYLKETRRERDKARQELKRLKQHLLEKSFADLWVDFLLKDAEERERREEGEAAATKAKQDSEKTRQDAALSDSEFSTVPLRSFDSNQRLSRPHFLKKKRHGLTARSCSTSFSKKVSRSKRNGDVGYIEFFKYPHDELMEDPGTIGSSEGASSKFVPESGKSWDSVSPESSWIDIGEQ
ncbi:unnamed protein product [Arabidopsis arenosa]|uniref:Uncharacterized protein n=1 Tax=Arabidopsis arenosa TaxID=38785 RepID=A0A8S2ADM1_ARAAE|nr:unnamed protein product [Arabidopsis arenosa]